MKIIKRLIYAIMLMCYLIIGALVPFWWFLPLLISGKSHNKILELYFNFIYKYNDKNNLFSNGNITNE